MLSRKLRRVKHSRTDGWLTELVSMAHQDTPFKCVHSYLVSIEPGMSRAGHFHNKKEEWLCITSGKLELLLESTETDEKETLVLDSSAKDYDIVYIRPKVAHLLTNRSREEKASIVVFSTSPEDKDDTFKHVF